MRAQEFFDLLLRWFHVIAGIMWIGNSMLFNWLDRNLVKPPGTESRPGFMGEMWMVHSGGFYQVEKKLLEPNQLPKTLHWFKWQNGFTWLSGIWLLVLVYYLNDGAFLIDPQVAKLTANEARLLGLGVIVGAWVVYDVVWRTIGHVKRWPHIITLGLLGGVAYGLAHALSGRAAYIHVGVVIGTIMTGNVWTVILPSQRALIAATKAGKAQDPAVGDLAKKRSIHNNYLTFPLIFIMISNHFPTTWGHELNWVVLLVIMAASAGVRLGMNLRYSFEGWYAVTGVFLVLGLITLLRLTWPEAPAGGSGAPVPFATANDVIGRRCRQCHSAHPTDTVVAPVAPGGIMFDTPSQIKAHAVRIKERATVLKTMPFTNKTGMTDEERVLLGRWVDQGAKTE